MAPMSAPNPSPRRRRPSGHVLPVPLKSGTMLYLKLRDSYGRQRKPKLGPLWEGRGRPPAGHWTMRQAGERLREVLVDMGRDPEGPVESVTLGDAAHAYLRYLEHERDRSDSTVRDYRNALRSRVLPFIGEDVAVSALVTEDVERLRRHLLGEVSRRTAQKHLVILHGLLAHAKRRGWVARNVAADAEKVSVTPPVEFAVLSPAEVFEVARHAADKQIGTMIAVAALTGLRMGELLALRWRDVDFTNRLVHVRRNRVGSRERRPKGRLARSVPLADQAARALDGLSRRERFTDPGDLVFAGPTAGHLGDKRVRRGLYEAMAAAGIDRDRGTGKEFVFHDLRHTFGTTAVRIYPLSDVQAYMGHQDVGTTMRYVHHVPQHGAADRLSALFEAEAGAADQVPNRYPSEQIPGT
jgi:integrase